MERSREPGDPAPEHRGQRFRSHVAAGALVVAGASLLLPQPEPLDLRPLLVVVALAAVTVGITYLPGVGERVSAFTDLAALLLTAPALAVTGGAESIYQNVVVVPMVVAAALASTRRTYLTAAIGLAVAASPALYDTTPGWWWTNLAFDGAVWLLAVTVIHQLAREQRAHTDELTASSERFRQLADQAQDGIYRLQLLPAPQFEYVNPAMEDLTGYPPSRFYEDPDLPLDHVHPEDRRLIEAARDGRRTSAGDPIEVRWRHPDGSTRWHALTEVPVRDADGRVVALQGIVRDVTAYVRLERDLRQHLKREADDAERLRQLDRLKNDFLRAVSHDLRAPLTTLTGFVETLDQRFDELDRDTTHTLIRRMAANTARLDRILVELLDLDRLERGAVNPTRTPHDLGELVRRSVAQADLDREVSVEVEPVTIAVDPMLVDRIVDNLLRNVARHTDRDVRVWVHLEQTPEGALLTIEDSGPGIADPDKRAVFEPFVRGSGDGRGTGTGVGLALVARWAQLHGGRAWVEDREGGGARFRVLFADSSVSTSP